MTFWRSASHEVFEELCALAMSDSLSAAEMAELLTHLIVCEQCRRDYEGYLLLTREGMPYLASRCAENAGGLAGETAQDSGKKRRFAHRLLLSKLRSWSGLSGFLRSAQRQPCALPSAVFTAITCLLLVLAGYFPYRLVHHTGTLNDANAKQRIARIASGKEVLEQELQLQKTQIEQLRGETVQRDREVAEAREDLRARIKRDEQRASELRATLVASANQERRNIEEQLGKVTQEHDILAQKLREAEGNYRSSQADLGSVRADRDRLALRIAALQDENTALLASNREQAVRLESQKQYLGADRDIRELMGARQLYIADLYDVSSDSHTRKPYGRIFYTKGKSLIFYAFDLDRGPRVKNTSFQAWGRSESSERTPVNLGILYHDNESNRRWVLRFDDPDRLAKIDTVFVTVEPSGGSDKPTSKPFLYASLRREPNHP